MLIEADAKVVMVGDSITDCGRSRPYGEGRREELGSGYVSIVEALLWSAYPERRIHIINMGVGGDSSRELVKRWHSDVVDLAPDWVTILVGINDVFRKFFKPDFKELQIPFDEYAANLKTMLDGTRSLNSKVVLMSPFFVEDRKDDPVRELLDRYISVCEKFARANGLIYVDVQNCFDRFLAKAPSAILSLDRLHPNFIGHMIIAKAFLDALGYDWNKT
jgi:lysophospholipase L1-like esterase